MGPTVYAQAIASPPTTLVGRLASLVLLLVHDEGVNSHGRRVRGGVLRTEAFDGDGVCSSREGRCTA
jgi:hypothetical protein